MKLPSQDPPFAPVDIIECEVQVGADTQTVKVAESIPLTENYDSNAVGNQAATVSLSLDGVTGTPVRVTAAGRYFIPLHASGDELAELNVTTTRGSYTVRLRTPNPLVFFYLPDSSRIYYQNPDAFDQSDTMGLVWFPPAERPFAYFLMAQADTTDTLIMSPEQEKEWKKYVQSRQDAIRNNQTLPDTMRIPRVTRMMLKELNEPAVIIPWLLFRFQGAYTITCGTVDSNYFNYYFSRQTRTEPTVEPTLNMPGEARGLFAAYAPVRFRLHVARTPGH